MPPTFRSSRSGRQFSDGPNRTRTGQIDHDVFEGLPVRRWSRQVQTISQEPKPEGPESDLPGQTGQPTVPEHPMPRDSHLLSPMSRALLRAARSGCIYIRKATKDYEDEEKDTTDADDQQTQQNFERNFSMRKWSTVPKHLEAPEVEFLAKRRPGLPSLYGATAGTVENANVPMRKTRFKKVDPVTGNISVYAAWVPEGHKIEGEITDDAQLTTENNQVTVTPQAPAPGTVIEGVGVVNAQGVVVAEAGSAAVLTPPRRRPPPPKRKGKGLKGRRKKVMFAPGEGADASLVHGANAGAGDGTGKGSDPARMLVDQTTQDDEDDEGEEGEESDDGEGEESGFDAKTPETPGPQPSTEPEPELTPVPAIGPTSTHEPMNSEVTNGLQPPQALGSAAGSEPISAHSVVPKSPEVTPNAPADAASTGQLKEPTTVSSIVEDVQMTDAMPTDSTLRSSIPAAETKPRATAELTQHSSTEISSPVQEVNPSSATGSLNAAAAVVARSTSHRPEEPMDVTMEESSESYSGPPPADPESKNASIETSQPQAEPTSGKESTPQQANQQRSDTDFDLLDNLEASLGPAPKVNQSEDHKVVAPEHKSESLNQGFALEPVAPVQPPTGTSMEPNSTECEAETTQATREDPVAPPFEQLTPPDAGQTDDSPARRRITTPTKSQKPDAAENPMRQATSPSDEAAAAAESAQDQSIIEQSKQSSDEPVSGQTASKSPAQSEVITESPTAQHPSQHSLPQPATEQQERTTATPLAEEQGHREAAPELSTQTTAKSVVEAAAEPVSEPLPAPASISELLSESVPGQHQPTVDIGDSLKEPLQPQTEYLASATSEPAVEHQSEGPLVEPAQEHGANGDGPDPIEGQQPQ